MPPDAELQGWFAGVVTRDSDVGPRTGKAGGLGDLEKLANVTLLNGDSDRPET